jgi:hypothetical protein
MSGIQQLLFGTKGLAGALGVITLSDNVLTVTGNSSALHVGYELNPDGHAYSVATIFGRSPLEQWVDPVGASGLFEVYVSVVSGGPVNGTINAWLPLSTAYQWYIQANTTINQSVVAKIAVTIRRVGQTTPEATAYIDLSAHK